MKRLRDIVAEKHPQYIDETSMGGVHGCPDWYKYLHPYLEEKELKRRICPSISPDIKPPERCVMCWDRVIKG